MAVQVLESRFMAPKVRSGRAFVMPSHGNLVSHTSYLMMAEETGYSLGSNFHLVRNGQELLID
jgi:mRNA degradation ribonuclease J1/J2